MTALELFNQPSPLKSEPACVREIVQRLASSLCTRFGFCPDSDDLVISCGYFSDKNNAEAVSTWVYEQLQDQSPTSQEELLHTLDRLFERKVDSLSQQFLGS